MNYLSSRSRQLLYPEPLPLMKYLQIYLVATIILYLIGPVEWRTESPFLTFLLVLIYQVSLLLGYKSRISKPICSYRGRFFSEAWFVYRFKLIASVVIAIKLIKMVRVAFLYGFSGIYDLVLSSFSSARSIYFAEKLATSGSQMFGGTPVSILTALLGPITVVFIPMFIITYKKLTYRDRLIGIIALILFVVSNILSGTNEGYFELVLYFMVGYLCKSKNEKKRTVTKKQKRKTTFLVVLGCIAVITLFNFVMTDRNGTYYNFTQLGQNTVNTQTWLYSIMPKGLRVLLIWLTFYICQGYYGMSLALSSTWYPLFGMGFSSYLRTNVESILGLDLTSLTLMAQTKLYGWKYGVNWHTVYTWFASDVWWAGVIVIMFLIGWLFAKALMESYYNHSPVSVGMLVILLTLIIFLPANPKVFANSDTFFAFFFYLFAWIFGKRVRAKEEIT